MNTRPEYRRHTYRPPESSYSPDAPTPAEGAKRVTWVRPTDLVTYSGPLVGRGIDLETELIRRARRTPITATRAVRRRVAQTLHRTPTSRTEGIGL